MSDDKKFDWLNFDLEMAEAATEEEIREWSESQPGGREAVIAEGKEMVERALGLAIRKKLRKELASNKPTEDRFDNFDDAIEFLSSEDQSNFQRAARQGQKPTEQDFIDAANDLYRLKNKGDE